MCLGEVPQDDDDDDDDCSNASSFPRGFDVVDMILLGEPEHPVFAPMRKQQMQMRVERWLNEL